VTSQKKELLKLYGLYSKKVAQLLKSGEKISMDDRTYIENHLVLVQLSLTISKYTASKGPSAVRL
jgi:hypothetical protein